MDLLISEVNSMDIGWKADVCKYQKTHPLYGKDCDKHTLSLAQIADEELVETDSTVGTGTFGDLSNKKF